ncbi:hypothetical protein M409DRAFT_15738 [Zasmidium cellare ATCC 36951]|uniref:Methyltransferase domain-containing protein n=1 Tax=Zasmidium cellare ATCC 36951 TaxID=1080233 RepID=A0A6A6D748_ZASCE|nr:uncharacterized protein M409DRAFT_15738 [Zasmidium cellare ATCC 36951]KAF2173456.1 hypothetical protein M409DRAFT_15738 [Zasmidium cellare ATCC 36951]
MSGETVSQWYNDHVELEDKRLILGRLEYEVTLHYIREAIDCIQRQEGHTNPLKIADIGCGTGVYAIPLVRAGHHLSISDISPSSVHLAHQKARAAGLRFTTTFSLDARCLRYHAEIYKPAHYDIVLLLGPVYHILSGPDRSDVLLAGLETVKPGGFMLAAFVTKNAHLRDVATRDPERLHTEWGFYEGYLRDGRYARGGKAPMWHGTIGEIRGLIEGLQRAGGEKGVESEVLKLVSCEGFLGFGHASHLASLGEEAFERWLGVVLESAADDTTLGAADHVLAVIRRTK